MATKARKTAGELPLDSILDGDCIEAMQGLPEASVDLIFADPPYNLQLKGDLHRPDNSKVDAVDDAWDQFDSLKVYDRFTREWLAAARRILKPGGAIWVIGSYHNVFRLGSELQNQGFWILNDVVWRKSNPMPNFRGKRLTNAHETLIWASKAEGAKYTFNYEALKAMNEGVQMRSDWVIPICTGHERLKRCQWRQGPSDAEARSPVAPHSGGYHQSGRRGAGPVLWHRNHRCGRQDAGAHYIGIEREKAYRAVAERRLAKVRKFDKAALEVSTSKRAEPRVPFGQLVERGMLRPGEMLVSPRGKAAKVRADGTLVADDIKGRSTRSGQPWKVRQAVMVGPIGTSSGMESLFRLTCSDSRSDPR